MTSLPQNNELDNQQNASLIFHPKNIILFLTLAGLTMLFLSLSFAYVYTRTLSKLPPLQLPWLFYVNTFVLLASSYTLWQSKKAYLEDRTDRYQQTLYITITLSFLFLVLQGIAWYSLFNQNIMIQTDNSAGYLYVISGLHFFHVVAGLPFLIYFSFQAKKYMIEPVSVLVYFSDPHKRLNLRLISIYWHFLDILWVYLMVFFIINKIIA
ncbi:MAG: cytochrome c oxidase subunit 3 [Saprospiraceae bacterium]|nr:cytochrome c oxidase subunit 3 [Saprospiraceae bacterium]MDP4701569.1 cytochrome c oxidase subunit 3 [Saprospiraceae bacterium]MDP4812542.1 cytochrome c oxidase subunit 3 [Saprospiraceae bacterium]MDP4812945.1 cytochrome c oxidase subunit 3 [Saprospiraceae bacterium]MDP4852789.1 cytochrome c oxidase subunit 3 [Saprospiraceae bacterium]